ncbi:MAG: gas vesicle protein K [Acidobacteria bacterium]|nr:gas vesicle protein K [Acidobacteriota bacterium]
MDFEALGMAKQVTPDGIAGPGEPSNNGLLRLVLGLAELLHELMERQALRRMELGQLDDEAVERLGQALAAQAEQLELMRNQHGLSREDINLDLGPMGTLF